MKEDWIDFLYVGHVPRDDTCKERGTLFSCQAVVLRHGRTWSETTDLLIVVLEIDSKGVSCLSTTLMSDLRYVLSDFPNSHLAQN